MFVDLTRFRDSAWWRSVSTFDGPHLSAIRASGRAIMALLLRESRTRYGRRSAGYVWALVTPMILLLAMMATFTILGRPAGAGDSMAVFFLLAIVPIRLWRGAVVRGGMAIRANRSLMRYPGVNAFEVIVARTVLESITLFMVLIIFILSLFAFFNLPFSSWIDDPLSLIGAIGALIILCFGSCFFSSQIGRVFEPWNEFAGMLGRVMLLTSGLWFTMGSIPPEFLAFVKYNPMAHIIEWIRHACIRDFRSSLFDPFYPIMIGTILLFSGMFIDWLYRISGYDMEI